MELVGTRDIATRLGVSMPRAQQLGRGELDFPAPMAVVNGATKVWDAADVDRWAAEVWPAFRRYRDPVAA